MNKTPVYPIVLADTLLSDAENFFPKAKLVFSAFILILLVSDSKCSLSSSIRSVLLRFSPIKYAKGFSLVTLAHGHMHGAVVIIPVLVNTVVSLGMAFVCETVVVVLLVAVKCAFSNEMPLVAGTVALLVLVSVSYFVCMVMSCGAASLVAGCVMCCF